MQSLCTVKIFLTLAYQDLSYINRSVAVHILFYRKFCITMKWFIDIGHSSSNEEKNSQNLLTSEVHV